MPNRLIREGIISSPRINALSLGAEVLYRRLMSVADDHGRFYGAPATILGACWPTAPDKVCLADVEQWLSECLADASQLLSMYEHKGCRYIQIVDFNQQTRSKSKFPEPAKQLLSTCSSLAHASRSRSRYSETETETAPIGAGVSEPSVRSIPALEQESQFPAVQALWVEKCQTIPSTSDWEAFQRRVWRPRSFHQHQELLARLGEAEGPLWGTPTSWVEAKSWERRPNTRAPAAKTNSAARAAAVSASILEDF